MEDRWGPRNRPQETNEKPRRLRNRGEEDGEVMEKCSLSHSETQPACSNVGVQLTPRGESAVLDRSSPKETTPNERHL